MDQPINHVDKSIIEIINDLKSFCNSNPSDISNFNKQYLDDLLTLEQEFENGGQVCEQKGRG